MSNPELKYPYHWGRGVVNSFVERYARGTYNMGKLIDLSPGEVRHGLIITLCRGKNFKFEVLKRVVKVLDSQTSDDLSRYSAEDKKLLYKYYVYLCTDDVISEKTEGEALDRWQNHNLPL